VPVEVDVVSQSASLRPLEGQVALVTGASSGIGLAIATALIRDGAQVHTLSRKIPHGLLQQARGQGSTVASHTVDLADVVAVEQVALNLARTLPRLDILVHAAGVIRRAPAEESLPSAFDYLWRVNVMAPFQLTRALLPLLRRSNGQLVFLNSSAALRPQAGIVQYAATKAALRAMADALREELNPSGVRVLSVFPGRTATPMQQEIFRLEGRPWEPEKLIQPEDIAAIVLQVLKLPRTAEVTEIHLRPLHKLS